MTVKKIFCPVFAFLAVSVCMAQTTGDVFAFGVDDGIEAVCVAANDKARFYVLNIDDGSCEYWSDVPDLALPKGYKQVFAFDEFIIGVVTADNKVRFYKLDDDWEYMSGVDFALPTGYKKIFVLGEDRDILGVVMADKIQFYWWTDRGWGLFSSAKLKK